MNNNLESKPTGTDSKQDRSVQPGRAGGNSDALGSESHGSPRGTQIAVGGSSGRLATDTGMKAPGRREFRGHGAQSGEVMFHGNAAGDTSICKHDQPKDMGKKSVGGKVVGEAPVVESNISVSERRCGAGNNADGGHEPSGQKKARTLDMSVKRFQR